MSIIRGQNKGLIGKMENYYERRNQGCAYSPNFTVIKTNVANNIQTLSTTTYVLCLLTEYFGELDYLEVL